MHKEAIVALAISIVLLSYLSCCFFVSPTNVASQLGLLELPDNAMVTVTAEINNSKITGNASIRFSGKSKFSLSSGKVVVTGYKKSYLNQSWVQALKIEYDT